MSLVGPAQDLGTRVWGGSSLTLSHTFLIWEMG